VCPRGRPRKGGNARVGGVRPRPPRQYPGFYEGAYTLLQEERVALRARNQELCEGCQAGIVPQQRLQELVSTRRGQGVQAELRIVGLAAPAVLILRAVVDQEQELSRGQALDQTVEQDLRLGIDPVQVREHQEQRLHLTFAQQHALERCERALAALGRIELAERALVRQRVEQCEERRQGVVQGLVQGQYLAGHLGAHGAR